MNATREPWGTFPTCLSPPDSRSRPRQECEAGDAGNVAGVRSRRTGRRGFTLLEVLLAMGLSVTLLLALWTLFDIYSNLFTMGQTKTENAQLARALLKQVADDLHSAIQDPIPGAAGEKKRTSTPLRRFVLDGSSNRLRLDVLQVTPLQGNPEPVSDSEQLAQEPSAARVPELRTISYTFRDPGAAPEPSEETEGAESDVESDVENLPGLVRREVDFETPSDPEAESESEADSMAAELAGASGILEDETAAEGASVPGATGALGPEAVDASITWVPEVVKIGFRYFDGNGWTSQWNSLSRKSLPVAVEVTLQLGTPAPRDETSPAMEPGEPAEAAEAPEAGEAGLDGQLAGELAGELATEPAGPTYRLVVDVPGSPKHEAPKKVEPVAQRPARRVVPRPVPRRVVPRPRPSPPREPEVQPLEDQWMRTSS